MKSWKMLIGPDQVDALDGRTFERRSPVHGEVVGTYPQGGEADAARAIELARRVFDEGKWSHAAARVRAGVLRKAADLIRRDADALARVITEEMGKPLNSAKGEVTSSADIFDYYAGLALDVHGEAYSQQVPDALGLTLREPIGVVGIITPWNFPFSLICWKLGPALAAGCTAVVKPSHLTPGAALELGRILLEAGLPAGVVSIVTSETDNGAVVGQALATHPMVDKVAFTGSTATGKKVMAAAATSLKRVSLELGGKSPNIVFADAANLDAAVTGAYLGIYANSGQVCQAGSRLLVEESIREDFVDRLVKLTAKKVKLGDPMEPGVTMGPIVSEPQLARVMSYVEAGRGEAKLAFGGARASEGALAKGLYVQPTIFDRVANDARIAREEIFGPVLSVLSFKDADEALRIANDTSYGLAAAVWTRDLNVAMRFAKGIKAGTVWVNAYHGAGFSGLMPYGGYKQSGIGRELGHEGLNEYLEVKSVQIKLS